jgi:L-lactate dehydrogenase (cytochrome)
MAGIDVTMPVALAPVGLSGMLHADGEILAAQAAKAFGVRYTLSTMSICSLEDIARHTQSPFWFQLYFLRDRGFMAELLQRALEANCDALILTLDLQVIGERYKDAKNGLSTPPRITPRSLVDMISHPRWCLKMLRTPRRRLGNIVGYAKGVSDITSLAQWTSDQLDPQLNWDDIAWVKARWPRKLILKGIMDIDDAHRAVASGADALIVSNHGGRQLDGAPSSIAMLADISDAVRGEIEVWLDSGIRSGQDVLKAVALGARGTLIGRAFLYGLAAFGQQGVTRVLEIIAKQLDSTMALCGHSDIRAIDRDVIVSTTVPRCGRERR